MAASSQLPDCLPIARSSVAAAGAVILWPTNRPACHGVSNIQAQLLWGLLFGSIGLGYFIYGKKQKAVVPLVCGLALIVFPYFVSNVLLLVVVGVLLTAIPYFLRL
jgi:hypothetical protein